MPRAGADLDFADFVLKTRFEDIPGATVDRVQDLILDLIGVGAGAVSIEAARIGRETAARLYGAAASADQARMLFDGRRVGIAGAAFAGATQIDALDAHDGYSPSKGHAGCALLPSVLAYAEAHPDLSGREALTAMVLGYEIACRAGTALHATVSDYHTSGAWVALSVAALGVRMSGGDPETLRHAVGIAEYHGPRSQMMREIDNPTMLHDGSGWGAMVGTSAAVMALSGFHGAPAITVEREDAAAHWADLGQVWLTDDQNIKLFPICRWIHAPIQAALNLRAEHGLASTDIAAVELHAFHEGTRLATDMPGSTAKAQYSNAYPVACALKDGDVTPRHVSGETFSDPEIARLVAATTVHECDTCNAAFPADRLGRTVLITRDGRRLDSGITRAPGEPSTRVDRTGITAKFHRLSDSVLGADRAGQIEATVFGLAEEGARCGTFSDLVLAPPD